MNKIDVKLEKHTLIHEDVSLRIEGYAEDGVTKSGKDLDWRNHMCPVCARFYANPFHPETCPYCKEVADNQKRHKEKAVKPK